MIARVGVQSGLWPHPIGDDWIYGFEPVDPFNGLDRVLIVEDGTGDVPVSLLWVVDSDGERAVTISDRPPFGFQPGNQTRT